MPLFTVPARISIALVCTFHNARARISKTDSQLLLRTKSTRKFKIKKLSQETRRAVFILRRNFQLLFFFHFFTADSEVLKRAFADVSKFRARNCCSSDGKFYVFLRLTIYKTSTMRGPVMGNYVLTTRLRCSTLLHVLFCCVIDMNILVGGIATWVKSPEVGRDGQIGLQWS